VPRGHGYHCLVVTFGPIIIVDRRYTHSQTDESSLSPAYRSGVPGPTARIIFCMRDRFLQVPSKSANRNNGDKTE
jgi:hypothetical protein